MRISALMLVLMLVVLAPDARAQRATAGLGLSDSVGIIPCALYAVDGCPSPYPGLALFRRYQRLAKTRTGGANSFRFSRTNIPWDAVATGGAAIGAPCTTESPPPAYYTTPWIRLAERFVLASRRAGLDPLISITNNAAARYPGLGNAKDPSSPSANQYLCAFKGIVSTLDRFAARNGIAPPTDYEVFNEPEGAQVRNSCNPTPAGLLRRGSAEQCAAWYYYEADVANRRAFGDRLTLVALAADGDSVNDRNLVAIKAYGRYLTGKLRVYPAVWSFHPYEDLSAAAYLDNGVLAHADTSNASAYIASLYRSRSTRPRIWLTELAAQVTDPVGEYVGVPKGCDDGEGDDPPPFTMGGCLDGNPKAQAYAASDFLALPKIGAAFPGEITRIYWHGWDSPLHHPTGWDSGLIAPGDQHVRTSYCVLTGESPAEATTDPSCDNVNAARDSEDSAWKYPEPTAAPVPAKPAAPAPTAPRSSGNGSSPTGCPQPLCAFRLLLTRLPELTSKGP